MDRTSTARTKENTENMKSDAFDGNATGTYHYSNNGLVANGSINTYVAKSSTAAVEAVIKALGTMILMPEYAQDPMDIGAKKQYLGQVQLPILMDDNRRIAEDKLIELIKGL